MSWVKISPELVVGDLADEAGACSPSAASPATVLAAEPPLSFARRAHRARRAASPPPRRSAASSPWACPARARKSSSASAITSTMALPIASTSRRGRS